MKFLKLLCCSLFLTAFQLHAQVQVDHIKHNSKDRFITTTIGYPVQGTFATLNQKQPITVLNPDGTGFIQGEDLSKQKINWGIECTEEGIPVFKEGFNSASYTFWYRPNNGEEWYYSQLSIHFAKKKMFLMGERVKTYEDYNVQ